MRSRFQYRVSDNGFWFTVTHPFVCPVCGGKGGYYGHGDEPDEPCEFCDEHGCVGLWAKLMSLVWTLVAKVYRIKYARRLKKTAWGKFQDRG